ncbi:MAG: GTP cyclohydrolase II [Deltaproteobacteria bacterium]|nr:GTP cyclohydrolase II [Deltaproteobacteria bacterium]
MFSYVDRNIQERFEDDRRLFHLDKQGNTVKNGGEEVPILSILGPIPLPIVIGGKESRVDWYPFVRRVQLKQVLQAAEEVPDGGEEAFRDLLQTNMSVNSLLAFPGFQEQQQPLIRLHSCCLTGDVFNSMRCECGPQLDAAFERIRDERGAVIYMSSHEGRGIGLWAKAITYLLQDDGLDTYQANVSLGLPEDSRDFSDAAIVLRYFLKGRPIRLLSNNPLKQKQLEQYGQKVAELVTLVAGVGKHNLRYVRSKRNKGHKLPPL